MGGLVTPVLGYYGVNWGLPKKWRGGQTCVVRLREFFCAWKLAQGIEIRVIGSEHCEPGEDG
jgi:hypothetical protein